MATIELFRRTRTVHIVVIRAPTKPPRSAESAAGTYMLTMERGHKMSLRYKAFALFPLCFRRWLDRCAAESRRSVGVEDDTFLVGRQ